MIKLVAFDWNGTLFSDTRAIYEGVNEVANLFHLKPIPFPLYQKYFDVPLKDAYVKFGIPEKELERKSQEAIDVFHTYYEERASQMRTRAYARFLLSWLSSNNIESVIFSNHIDYQIMKHLKRLHIENFFSEILANSTTTSSYEGRYKKEKLKECLKKSHVHPSEVLVIGDTVEEVEIGKELGAVTVSITGGNCSTVRLKSAQPDYLIHNLKGVIGIIQKLNSSMSPLSQGREQKG